MQPLHHDLQCPAAKDNSINSTTHAAAAPSNLDAAIVYNAILRYWTAKHNRTIATAWEIAPPKPDLGAKAEKKILKHFWKGIFKGKSQAPKLRKSADKSLSQPWCSHSITIYDVQLQKTIVLCMQPRHQATLTQPLYTMRFWDIELQSTIELSQQREKLHLQNRISAPKRKKRFWSTFEKEFSKENHQRLNWENLLTNHYRSLDAATPLRFTMSSYKRQ